MDSTYVDVKKISDETEQWLVDDMHTHLLTFGNDGEPSIVGALSEDHFQILDECPKAIVYAALPFLNLLFAMNAIPHEEDDAFVCISTIRPREIPENVVEELDVKFDIRSSELVYVPEKYCNEKNVHQFHDYVGPIPEAIHRRLSHLNVYNRSRVFFDQEGTMSLEERVCADAYFVPGMVNMVLDYLSDAGSPWDFKKGFDYSWTDAYVEYMKNNRTEDDWAYDACFRYSVHYRRDIDEDEIVLAAKDVFELAVSMLIQNGVVRNELVMQEGCVETAKELFDELGFASAVDAYLSGVPVEDIVA